ncbi:MAG: glycine oxidase ThiO [Candidatus Latescibacteria bacterium]|nr:glycine oxidase ThiO [Candidatus Latescibacterota bacterium]
MGRGDYDVYPDQGVRNQAMSEPGESAELVVVGGGVIGLSVAYEARRRGLTTVVLERDRPGEGATRAAGGMLGPIAEADVEPPELVEFGRESLRRYPDFVARVEEASGESVGFREEGTLLVALNRDQEEEIEHFEETLAERGLGTARLGSEEIRRLEPHLSPRVLSGLHLEEDRRVDPRALARALAAALRASGARVESDAKVVEVLEEGGRTDGVRYRLPGLGRLKLRAPRVVLAAGAWSWSGIHVPVPDPGLRPVKGQLVMLRGPELLRHVVRTPDAYFVPQPGGDLLLGATAEEMGFDLRPTAGATFDLLRAGREALPGIYDLEILRTAVGLRPVVDDHLPLIGATAVEGLYLAVGHYRHGVLLAPATSELLAEWMVKGRRPEALAPFDPARLHRSGEDVG